MLEQIVSYMFETGLEIAGDNLPHVIRQTIAKVVARKGTDLYYTIRGQKTDREILVELDDKINSLGRIPREIEAIEVIKKYTASFNASFQQNAEIYEEISGLNERLRSGALESQLKLQLIDVLKDVMPHYGIDVDDIENLVRESTSDLHLRFDDVEEMLNRFGGDLGDIRDGVYESLEFLRQICEKLGIKFEKEKYQRQYRQTRTIDELDDILNEPYIREITALSSPLKDIIQQIVSLEEMRSLDSGNQLIEGTLNSLVNNAITNYGVASSTLGGYVDQVKSNKNRFYNLLDLQSTASLNQREQIKKELPKICFELRAFGYVVNISQGEVISTNTNPVIEKIKQVINNAYLQQLTNLLSLSEVIPSVCKSGIDDMINSIKTQIHNLSSISDGEADGLAKMLKGIGVRFIHLKEKEDNNQLTPSENREYIKLQEIGIRFNWKELNLNSEKYAVWK